MRPRSQCVGTPADIRQSDAFFRRVSAEGLGAPTQAKVVRAGKDGKPITDGVFPESKEFLAEYLIFNEGRMPCARIFSSARGPAQCRRLSRPEP